MNLDRVSAWLNDFKLESILALVGLILVGAGVFWWRVGNQPETKVEVLSASDSAESSNTIYVDISGSVVKPGVYGLSAGSRVEDAIEAAGSFRPGANLDWVAANLNRAMPLTDGAKVYIPSIEDTSSEVMKTTSEKIGINSAAKSDLESLPGIGPVTAEKIISNRPYQTIEELLSKKAMGQKLFDSLEGRLSLW